MALPSLEEKKRRVQKIMTGLGIYDEQYDHMIDLYVGLLMEYEIIMSEYIGEFVPTMIEAGGELIKNPDIPRIEKLRIQIGAYADRLMLNPRARYTGKAPQKKDSQSKLDGIIQLMPGAGGGRNGPRSR